MVEAILWDVDGTLLNFKAAERVALRSCFLHFGLGECTDEMVASYSAINVRYWELLELGRMTKPEILTERFREFFDVWGITGVSAEEFDGYYHEAVAQTVEFNDDSYHIVEALKGKYAQYVVSNGTHDVQMKKLSHSGFDRLMDGIFLSDDLGYEKPHPEFFRRVFETIPATPATAIIVGDSLTGDIRGGNTFGVYTVWYNPAGGEKVHPDRVDREIRHLGEIFEVLRELEQDRVQ